MYVTYITDNDKREIEYTDFINISIELKIKFVFFLDIFKQIQLHLLKLLTSHEMY